MFNVCPFSVKQKQKYLFFCKLPFSKHENKNKRYSSNEIVETGIR